MGSPVHTPHVASGAPMCPWGTVYAMVVEVALAITPGNERPPKGTPGPLAERYDVGPEYPSKLGCKWSGVLACIFFLLAGVFIAVHCMAESPCCTCNVYLCLVVCGHQSSSLS